MDHLFQVNLQGIIELLSNHLYSGPQVFARELLQNAVDAITARHELEREAKTSVSGEPYGVRVYLRRGDGAPELVFEDDGIGLDEPEIHQFLATLGESSKRRFDPKGAPIATDLIGQFGIGLLSCFLVSEEIVVRTRSARSPDAGWVEWRGQKNGTYQVKQLGAGENAVGTRVSLSAREDRLEWFESGRVEGLLRYFGALLRCPIDFIDGERRVRINRPPPWRSEHTALSDLHDAVRAYGRDLFEVDFMDWIPLRSARSGTEGVAFVLPFAPNLAEPRTHRVYLKGMLVSEQAREILPNWAFFVTAVVDANRLRPTASREAFYEDELLETTREELGLCIKAWLLHVCQTEPARLTALIAVHHRSIKALAATDDDVLALFGDFLPFETTQGTMSFGELRAHADTIEYATTIDAFRQMAPVASAQGKLLVNAGFAFDEDVLTRAAAHAQLNCQALDSTGLTETLEDLTPRDQAATERFVTLASKALSRFGCEIAVKQFRPEELPAFYATSNDTDFRRQIERTREKSKGIWSDILGSIASRNPSDDRPLLCFNFRNPLIRRLVNADDADAVTFALELLYVHALLLGHQPLKAAERQILPTAILGFIEWGLGTRRGGMLQ